MTHHVTNGAANGGQLDVLKWARCNNYELNDGVCSNAATGGAFRRFEVGTGCWLRMKSDMLLRKRLLGGHLELLKWARENGCEWDAMTCASAAKSGNLDILKWARQNGCEWDQEVGDNAVLHGHLEILDWIGNNGYEWTSQICSSAARAGNLEVIKWAIANGSVASLDVFRGCAWGHLEILQWARNNGCKMGCLYMFQCSKERAFSVSPVG